MSHYDLFKSICPYNYSSKERSEVSFFHLHNRRKLLNLRVQLCFSSPMLMETARSVFMNTFWSSVFFRVIALVYKPSQSLGDKTVF